MKGGNDVPTFLHLAVVATVSRSSAPVARRCLAVSSALARCVLRTHSLRLSVMTRELLFNALALRRTKVADAENCCAHSHLRYVHFVNVAARAKSCLILLPLHDGEETPNCGSLC